MVENNNKKISKIYLQLYNNNQFLPKLSFVLSWIFNSFEEPMNQIRALTIKNYKIQEKMPLTQSSSTNWLLVRFELTTVPNCYAVVTNSNFNWRFHRWSMRTKNITQKIYLVKDWFFLRVVQILFEKLILIWAIFLF